MISRFAVSEAAGPMPTRVHSMTVRGKRLRHVFEGGRGGLNDGNAKSFPSLPTRGENPAGFDLDDVPIHPAKIVQLSVQFGRMQH